MGEKEYKEIMNTLTDVQLEIREMKTKIDESVKQRFEEHDRRISSIEQNQRWVALAVIGAVIATIMGLVTIS